MATGRRQQLPTILAIALASLVGSAGCSQSGPFRSRQTQFGALKASVSSLEFENEKLRREVADLKSDNSRLDRQLGQEKDVNGEITARLDDARNVIRQQGGDASAIATPAHASNGDDLPPPATSSPVRRSKAARRPPAVQIPQPESSFGNDEGFDSSANWSTPAGDLGLADRTTEDNRWLPVPSNRRGSVRQ